MNNKIHFYPYHEKFLIKLDAEIESNTLQDMTYLTTMDMIIKTDNGYKIAQFGQELLSQRERIPLWIIVENDAIVSSSNQMIYSFNLDFPNDYDYNSTNDEIIYDPPIKLK